MAQSLSALCSAPAGMRRNRSTTPSAVSSLSIAISDPIGCSQISAAPADINVLDEYSGDPRVVSNLTDGVYRTRDDMHLWLAPFTPGRDHLVHVRFAHTAQLAMLRIWVGDEGGWGRRGCEGVCGTRVST